MAQTNRFFRFCIGIILILLVIFLGDKVKFIFNPLISLLSVILVPAMLAGFFYYLLRPLVELMHKRRVNRTLAIFLIYLVFGLIMAGFIIGIWPSLREQFLAFIENAPNLIKMLTEQVQELEESGILAQFLPEEATYCRGSQRLLIKGLPC